MKNYKIYKIVNQNNEKPIYIGCTSQQLNRRLWQHNHDVKSQVYNQFVSKGENNLRIELILEKECTTAQAMKMEELITYIYGKNYPLCNHNAGGSFYENNLDEPLYDSIHTILFEMIHNENFFTKEFFEEVAQCIANILNYELNEITNTALLEMDDICCEMICNEDF